MAYALQRSAILMLAVCLTSASRSAPRPVTGGLRVTHRFEKTERRKGQYFWLYRTEVRNLARVPVRITSMECREWDGRDWRSLSNVTGHPLRTREFARWYTEGDPVKNGWIVPGKTAVCDPNYNFAPKPNARRVMWTFAGEDAHGKRHSGSGALSLPAAGH